MTLVVLSPTRARYPRPPRHLWTDVVRSRLPGPRAEPRLASGAPEQVAPGELRGADPGAAHV